MIIDVKVRPDSFFSEQRRACRYYQQEWYRQRTGEDLPTWVIVAESLVILPMIFALFYIVAFL